jgi:hypothetical protein
MNDKAEKIYDLVVTTLMVAGVALNVYLMMDVASNGQVTKDVLSWWERCKENMRQQRDLIRDRSRVIAHAEWAKYEAVMDDEKGSES